MMQRGEMHLIKIFFMSFIFLFLHCGLFEPERKTGSLQIILQGPASSGLHLEGGDHLGLEKATETLSLVQCIVKKGTETKYDGNLTKQGSTFHGEIEGLEAGSDYSVLLYGKNSSGEMIARGFQAGLNVSAGKPTTAVISWNAFKPVLSSPANAGTSNNNQPSFSWSAVSNASAYELIVDNNGGFASPEINQTSLTTAGYTAANLLADGTYYWKVRCKDSSGNLGGWSETWSFTITTQGPIPPTLVSPANGSTIGSNKPAFDWNDVNGAVMYELIVDNSSGFGSPEINQPSLSVSNYTAMSSLADGTYYWKVRSKDNLGNWGAWSGAWNVTIKTVGPGAPTLVSPTDAGTTNDITPAFDWSDVSGAASYELIVDNNSGFGSPEIDQVSLTASNYTAASSLADGTYYWKVRCKDSVGNWGAWSGVWSFIISTTVPTPVISAAASVDFGTVTIGNSSDQTLRISNTGNAALSVTGITSTNAQFAMVGSTTFNVSAGSYQDVTVRFTPSTVGSQSGTLHIANNSSVNPKDVSLSGTGTGTVATPTFNPSPGTYNSAQNVTINCTTPGATIHYTTNGVDPTESDPTVSSGASVTISSTTTLKARAYKSGWTPSSITSGMYIINSNTGTVTDIDGNIYQTVSIGSQVWMAENLKVTHYRNGDAIPNVVNGTSWLNLITGAYCNYNNDANNAVVYGYFYNWYAVYDSRNIAPAGWHVPSDAEWQTLIKYLGGDAVAGGKMKESGTTHWQSPNSGATNESGFSALPGNHRDYNGSFFTLGSSAYFWSSSEPDMSNPPNLALGRRLLYDYSGVSLYPDDKRVGFSVRLIRD